MKRICKLNKVQLTYIGPMLFLLYINNAINEKMTMKMCDF